MKQKILSTIGILTVYTVLCSLFSFVFIWLNPAFQFRFLSVWFYVLSLTFIPVFLCIRKVRHLPDSFFSHHHSYYGYPAILWGLICTAVVSRFAVLNTYPFVALGDELRDGGLNAFEIISGVISNVYGFGRYESHGLIIPTMTALFLPFFPHSILMYRIPAAIIATCDILFLYFGVRILTNARIAFWAALMLIATPLHMFYGRTEIVVILSSIVTTASILMLGYVWNRRIPWYAAIATGLFMGFAATLHTSARTVMVLTFILFLTKLIWDVLFRHKSVQYAVVLFGLILISALAGFGPKIFFTTPSIFFQSRSFALPIQKDIKTEANTFLLNAKKSLLVYVSEPTASHFPIKRPILRNILGLLLLIGAVTALFTRIPLFMVTVIYGLAIPMTNSAITECINCDHRLAPLFPVIAILVGLGISRCIQFAPSRWFLGKLVVTVLLFLCVCIPGINFFLHEEANANRSPQEYLSMYLIRYLQSRNSPAVCISAGDEFISFLKLMHCREQYQYLLPNVTVDYQSVSDVAATTVIVSPTCVLDTFRFTPITIPCHSPSPFLCPPNVYADFMIESAL